MDSKLQNRLDYLAFSYCEGTITKDEIGELNSILLASDPARKYYYQFIKTRFAISKSLAIKTTDIDIPTVNMFEELRKLAEYETTAAEAPIVSAIEDNLNQPQLPRTLNDSHQKLIRKIRYYTAASIIFALLVLAALQLPGSNQKLAEITDSINTTWSANPPQSNNNALYSNDGTRQLEHGYLKIHFVSGPIAIIEAPASFELIDSMSMKLNYGKIYANIEGKSGFTVDTPVSTIIDLGTEFGVNVTRKGTSDLHMIKGKARISTQTADGRHISQDVLKGNSLRVTPGTNTISSIKYEDNIFAREISSAAGGFVWKGQPISLATIAPSNALPLLAGSINANFSPANSKFIDGIFSLNSSANQFVSSIGHKFAKSPIVNQLFPDDISINPNTQSVTISGNAGITYDLAELRRILPPNAHLTLQTTLALSDSVSKNFASDFWVLLDGKAIYQRYMVNTPGLCDKLKIDIDDNTDFLTLAATQYPFTPGEPTDSNIETHSLFTSPAIVVTTQQPAYQTAYRVLFDFGPSNENEGRKTTNPDQNNNYWNSFQPFKGGDPIIDGTTYPDTVVSTDNIPLDLQIEITNAFGSGGKLIGSQLNPDNKLLGDFAIQTVTEDFWYELEKGASLKFTNLNPDMFYDLRLLGTRDSDEKRISRYRVTDANGSQSNDLQTSGTNLANKSYNGNTDTIIEFPNLSPDSNGEISLEVIKVFGAYAYLNGLELTAKTAQ